MATKPSIHFAPLPTARLGGALYLIIIVVGIFSEVFVRDALLVSGDPVTTAQNIIDSEPLWRLGLAGGVLMLICALILALILYILLKPVNRYLALLAVLFNLVSISIEAAIKLSLIKVLLLIKDTPYLQDWPQSDRFALAYQEILLHSSGYNISLVFFGVNCLLWGYLFLKSGFFPRLLGILLLLCGGCYIINSFAWFLAPRFAALLFPGILVPCLIAELSVCLWLLIKGIHVQRWRKQSGLTV